MLFDSLTRNVLLAPMSSVQPPIVLKLLKPRFPTCPGLVAFSSTSPGVPSALRLARAVRVHTFVAWRLVPILSPAVTCVGSVHCGSGAPVNWLPNKLPEFPDHWKSGVGNVQFVLATSQPGLP